MKTSVVLDYHLATGRVGYVVRALLKFEGDSAAPTERIPLNLSLVLDRSGSMSGHKLSYARRAAADLVRRLRPEDVVSVVAYDDVVTTIAEPQTGDAQRDLPAEIENIESGGSTNLSGGWLRGRELVARNGGKAINRVLLMTDGLANVGLVKPPQLVGLCTNGLENGITTSTIGFGEDHDEDLLRAMAEAGGGHSYYIENPDQAPGVFEEEIEGLLSLAAQNIEVKIAPEQSVELVNVHNNYPSHGAPDGITVTLGDLYAREPKSLLIEFFVDGLQDQGAREIARIKATADVLTAGGGVERQEISVPVSASLDGAGGPEPEIERTQLLLDAARAREEARERGRRGDFDGAADLLMEVNMACMAAPELGAVVAEQAADLSAMADKYRARDVSSADEKYLYQRAYNARRGKAMYEEKISRQRKKK
ncbi:MAG: VWA domain-containing protein [Gemmatimonadota bacterium]|nr:VWA domain-containing protein [Gemmatimonadota bacterium]